MKLLLLNGIKLTGLLILVISVQQAFSQNLVLDGSMHHLRNGQNPEWASFSEPHQGKLRINFESTENAREWTLCLRQEDVRQNWLIRLNGQELGRLTVDENLMIDYWVLNPQVLKTGQNTLLIEPAYSITDDILVGNIVLIDRPLQQLLREGTVEISVSDGQTGSLLPARLTIVDKDGALQPLGAAPERNLAIRTGCLVTGNGKATFGLPEGVYTLYANHGFEYGVDSVKLEVRKGMVIREKLVISKEVPTEGWVSSDTHIHTNYYAGDGDANLFERALSIAAEGIELPVLTDHNLKSNLDSIARLLGVRKYFTPVVGYEYTTPLGHFNVFPVPIHTPVAAPPIKSWNEVAENLQKTDHPPVVILNHARDTHQDFRPFDPQYHISCSGTDLRHWKFPANAMEVINSSAALTDYMSLYEDWFGMMNRGYGLTPVGASDSHHVYRYLVGQGRTYIKTRDENPDKIDQQAAIKNFKDGNVMVCMGLLTEIVVDGQYGPGELVPSSTDELTVSVRVLGPGWTSADRIALYANGIKIREEVIPDGEKAGVKYTNSWKIPRPKHDVFLVAIAEGPGGHTPFWRAPKPYQNTSPIWNPHVIGSTGAVWIDGDRDGQRSSARMYADKLLTVTHKKIESLVVQLASYDAAVAIQVAAMLQEQGADLSAAKISIALDEAAPSTKAGFQRFIHEYQLTKGPETKQGF
ncbi:MAG TPA: CehA/McbA family metallohydrolase [Prolixibacteraceae bacterium]|jgi:hypothetical protein